MPCLAEIEISSKIRHLICEPGMAGGALKSLICPDLHDASFGKNRFMLRLLRRLLVLVVRFFRSRRDLLLEPV